MIVYLKNGLVIETDDVLVSTGTNGAGELVKCRWTHGAPGTRALYELNLNEVVAIVDTVPETKVSDAP